MRDAVSSKKEDNTDDLNTVPSYIEEAIKNETLVEGFVESRNSGGYRILVRGTSCFCPFSLFPRIDDEDFFKLVKNKIILNFKVIKAEIAKNIIVSRIDVAKQEGIVKAKKIYDSKNYIYGKIIAVKDYGTFVDIGGICGLLHISKYKHNFIPIIGDTIKSIIIAIDLNSLKISLSSLVDEKIYANQYNEVKIDETKNIVNKKNKPKNIKSDDMKVKCKFCNVEVFSKRLKKHIKRVHSKNIINLIYENSEETNINKPVVIYKGKKYRSLYDKYGV